MDEAQLQELLLQTLEHEIRGIALYQRAIECALNEDLREEWESHLEQTREHVGLLRAVCAARTIDPEAPSAGREIVAQLGRLLLGAIGQAAAGDSAEAAQLVACDCVALAETKEHFNWQLLGDCARHMRGPGRDELYAAYEDAEDQEDERLYHSMGWTRELWADRLGIRTLALRPQEQRDAASELDVAADRRQAGRASQPLRF